MQHLVTLLGRCRSGDGVGYIIGLDLTEKYKTSGMLYHTWEEEKDSTPSVYHKMPPGSYVCDLSKHFSDGFIISATTFMSYWMINYGPIRQAGHDLPRPQTTAL